MPAKQVDLVLAIDCSSSMQPCFDGLLKHLEKLVQPLQGLQLRVGFVAMAASYSAEKGDKAIVYPIYTLAGMHLDALEALYRSGPANQSPRSLFTTDSKRLMESMRQVCVEGDEDLLVLLDTAADFPFDNAGSTRRVVALFSDEPIEDGLDPQLDRIEELGRKYMARRIKLFAALPNSPAADELGAIDGSEIECVSGGDGLQSVDFGKLFAAMAKSITVSCQETVAEAPWKRALFCQDQWVKGGSMSGGR